MISKREAEEVEARVEKDFQILDDLMNKFGIDPEKDNAYFHLLIALTRKHYPDGVKRVGRPRNPPCVSRFWKQLKPRKRGRPESKKEFRKELLIAVDGIIAEHGFKGRGSAKKALEILIQEIADANESKLRLREKYLKPWKNDLSRARALNRKNT